MSNGQRRAGGEVSTYDVDSEVIVERIVAETRRFAETPAIFDDQGRDDED